MKKLFFAAALAIVAVGGAVSTKADVFAPGSTTPLPCEIGEITCALVYGDEGYSVPFSTNPNDPQQDTNSQVDLRVYSLIQ